MNLDTHVRQALYRAVTDRSRLDSRVLQLDGMSSPKVRHFLNNVCQFRSCRYLEVGCWKGSTLIAAIFDNAIHYWGIDNWSEWKGSGQEDSRAAFFRNYATFFQDPPRLIEQDFTQVDLAKADISGVNVYFYDGSHTEQAQFQALAHFLPALADPFVYIVDDWNEGPVRAGTERAVKELGLHAIYHVALPALVVGDLSLWWNGLGIYVFAKRRA